jgi:hypothetical protein
MAHQSARRNNGAGSYSQAVLDVEGVLSETALRTALDQIADRFPLIHGRIARDWLNLAPYWKVKRPSAKKRSQNRSTQASGVELWRCAAKSGRHGPSRRGCETTSNPRIPLQVIDLRADQADRSEALLADHANAPFRSRSEHLRFLLIRIGDRQSRLGMVFDHRLLDAFGSEMFFRLIDQTCQGKLDEISPRVKQTEPAHLDHWKRRFQSGKTLNRLLHRLGTLEICGLRMPSPGKFRPMRMVHDSLSREETISLNKKAGEEIGVPILLPSAAARAIDSMREVLAESSLPGAQYLIFTSANTRTAGQEWEKVFFNHFSLLPFSIESEPRASIKEMAVVLRNQFFAHMKEKLPVVMEDASALGRICPFWIGDRLLRLVANGRMCSFYFVCLKDNGYSSSTFMGHPVRNLFHQPLVFSPPGLNICMTEFGGRFNLVISYMQDVIDDVSAKRLMQEFKSVLLQPRPEPVCR